MQEKIRRSLAAKIVAIGFIILILFGNFLFVKRILGQKEDDWMVIGAWLGLGCVLIGGIALIFNIIKGFMENNEH